MTTEVQLVSTKDAARRLGVSRQTLWRWRGKNLIDPPISIGTTKRWRSDSLDRVMQQGAPGESGATVRAGQ